MSYLASKKGGSNRRVRGTRPNLRRAQTPPDPAHEDHDGDPDRGVDEAHGNAHDALQAQPRAGN